ncbi:hypothetical protein PGB90_006993 [Kerria lacca]
MTDINFLNMFYDHENSFFNLDKDDIDNKKIEKRDEDHEEWFNDTLNLLLKSSEYDYPLLLDQFLNSENEIIDKVGHECSSDSGLSCEQSYSPARTDETDEMPSVTVENSNSQNLQQINLVSDVLKEKFSSKKDTDSVSKNEIVHIIDDAEPFVTEYIKEEIVECEEFPITNISFVNLNSDSNNDDFILESSNNDISQNDTGTDSSVFSYRSLKAVKLTNSNSKYRIRRLKNFALKSKHTEEMALKESDNDDSDFIYPRLQLTLEEQKLANKEGIKLPSHYPLTKSEERELKRIRRKIRNKISAQDSRRRKKEYVDGLEEKVKRTSAENAHLMKRIKNLENQKMTLVAQVRKLQASLARCSGQTAQPSTCLFVLIMSLALVLAPTLKNNMLLNENNDDEGISLSEDNHSAPLNTMRSSSRNLLFSHKSHEGQCNLEEETKTLSEQLQKIELPNSKVLTNLLELLKLKIGKDNSLLKDHDYFKPRKRPSPTNMGNEWLPSKIPKTITNHLLNMTDTITLGEKNKSNILNFKEPVIVDLLSD